VAALWRTHSCHGLNYCCDACNGSCTCSVNGKCSVEDDTKLEGGSVTATVAPKDDATPESDDDCTCAVSQVLHCKCGGGVVGWWVVGFRAAVVAAAAAAAGRLLSVPLAAFAGPAAGGATAAVHEETLCCYGVRRLCCAGCLNGNW
jgi:hypothetical protein